MPKINSRTLKKWNRRGLRSSLVKSFGRESVKDWVIGSSSRRRELILIAVCVCGWSTTIAHIRPKHLVPDVPPLKRRPGPSQTLCTYNVVVAVHGRRWLQLSGISTHDSSVSCQARMGLPHKLVIASYIYTSTTLRPAWYFARLIGPKFITDIMAVRQVAGNSAPCGPPVLHAFFLSVLDPAFI